MSVCERVGSGSGAVECFEVEGQLNICLGREKISIAEAEASYARWASTVLYFCELFLGEKSLAEHATTETFVRFFQGGSRGATEGIPVPLLDLAFHVVSQSPTGKLENLELLRAAIVHLDAVPRAVFILHGVMSMQMPRVGAIFAIPPEYATQLWAKALVEFRERLPQDFFKERRR